MAELGLNPEWAFVADTVMGGVSQGALDHARIGGREAARLTGTVSLDNNGGFIQMAADLTLKETINADAWEGLRFDVLGNDETYDIRLKTEHLTHVWQSFRTDFVASHVWMTLSLPFSAFQAYRTDAAFEPSAVNRIGILAVGRAFSADVAVSNLRLYR